MKSFKSLVSLLLCVYMLFSPLASVALEKDTTAETTSFTEQSVKEGNCEHILEPTPENILPTENIKSILSDKNAIKQSILSKETFTVDGYVTVDGKTVSIEDHYDFSDLSKYQITEWAHTIGVITEEDAIDCLCQLILDRNFDNVTCLESVTARIFEYRENNTVSDALATKIDRVLTPGISASQNETDISTRTISSEATYSNTYFTIHYDTSLGNGYSKAVAVANYFVTVRTAFINMGYRTPILQTGQNKYHVYLDLYPAPSSSDVATTTKANVSGNKCASYITLYNFSELTDNTKETIAHEYFHAIQNAYNYQSGWLKEAMANWGAIVITNTSSTCDTSINDFINNISNNTSMPTTNGYGAVLFPLAIHRRYGANAILKIYEEYATWSSTDLTLAQLREVITNGIYNHGSTDGFDRAYRNMISYIYTPYFWFDSVYSGSLNWTMPNSINIKPSSAGSVYTITGSVTYLSAKYYTISFPDSVPSGDVKVEVTFSGNNGCVQKYRIGNDEIPYSSHTTTTNNKVSFMETSIGETVNSAGFIISNLNNSGSLTYTVKITVMPSKETFNFASGTRYAERELRLSANDGADFYVTFTTSGSKMVQTVGTADTCLRIFDDETGELVKYDNDSGYSTNAFIRVDLEANKRYRIRVIMYNSEHSGNTKLIISNTKYMIQSGATSIEQFENIMEKTGTSFSQATSIIQYHVKAIVFKPTVNGTYTIKTTGEVDTYLYVIDPRSSLLLSPSDQNDDSDATNAAVTKQLESNVPYLILYSSFNPGNEHLTGNIYLKATKS